jgi:multidrug efflux pump
MTDFFIKRPVTATVLNLMLMVIGVLAFRGLTVDEYPKIIVPKIKVSTGYPNASSETVEKEITSPIEEAMSLVEGVERISSSSSSGLSEVRLRFLPSVSMDKAVMQVTEQLSRIRSYLPLTAEPPQIMRGGDRGGNGFMYLGVKSKELSGAALTHFANTHIKNYFQGIDGVAEVDVMGSPYIMNIKLNTLALHTARVSPSDIIKVLKQNELLLQAGRMSTNEPISLDVVAKDAEDYRRMIVGINAGVPVLLGDVAEINLEDDDQEFKIRVDGQSAVVIGVSKSPDGNSLAVADAVYEMVKTVNREVRGKAVVSVDSDHSVFIRASLGTIVRTIVEACILVILIIFLFLRHFWATMVPLVTIPISLVATFFAIKIFGLSINTITLLAMVLAVGLVVDDAIVVLENIFRYREQGLSSLEAAQKGSREIGFAIVAMTCTLVSVFLPLAFISDITGTILREFAITLASAVFFSGITALTLSPLMSAYLLKRQKPDGPIGLKIENAINWLENSYQTSLLKIFSWRKWVFLSMAVLLLGGGFLYSRLTSDLLPKEDRGVVGAFIPAIAGFLPEDIEPYLAQVEQIFLGVEGIERSIVMSFSEGGNVVSVLKPWNERSMHAEKVVAKLREKVSQIPTINVYPWSWNVGLSALDDNSQDRPDVSVALKTVGTYEELDEVAQKLIAEINKEQVLVEARSDLDMNEKAYSITMLREPQAYLGIDEKTVSVAVQAYSHRVRAADFKKDGQRYNVYLQPDVVSEDLNSVYISTAKGDSVPLATVAQVKKSIKAPTLKHTNQMRTAHVSASLGKGQSLSDAKAYLDKLIKEHVPKDISVSYEGMMDMQKKASDTFILLFLAGLIFIFAIMAVQFEGVLDPLIILVTVPFACLGGIFMLWVSGTGTNLYTQVGMLTLIGLITKHGILLTEFVGQKRALGVELKEAVFLASRLRFRPIIMTTAATVLGAVPLVWGSGAGFEARQSIGLVIVGGMIFGTVLTLFVLPLVIYSVHMIKARYT